MIIICPECSTKFKLNPERLPVGGGKVRCARCRHIFRATPPGDAAPGTPPSEAPTTGTGRELDDSSAAPAGGKRDTQQFPAGAGAAEDFTYDRFQELDSDQQQADEFTFGTDESEPAEAGEPFARATPAASTQDEEFSFSDVSEASLSPYEKIINGTQSALPETEPAATEPSSASARPAPAEPEFPERPSAPPRRSPLANIFRLLLVLILILLIVGGVLVYLNGPEQLNQTVQQLFGRQGTSTEATGQITLSTLEGKFIQNEQAGELFLIRGEAVNQYSEPRAAIQVRGVIYDQNSKPLLQKTIFCGNPISDAELRTLSFAELEKKMGNQFGKDLSNMKVNPQQAIPFAIVFKDLPENLAEFSVKVTSSEPASK